MNFIEKRTEILSGSITDAQTIIYSSPGFTSIMQSGRRVLPVETTFEIKASDGGITYVEEGRMSELAHFGSRSIVYRDVIQVAKTTWLLGGRIPLHYSYQVVEP